MMAAFYDAYAIVTAIAPELTWDHYKILVTIRATKQRRQYQEKAVALGWTAEELALKVVEAGDPGKKP